MNKYTGLSDFEINCQVLATFEPDIKYMCLSHDVKSFYHCGADGSGFYETTIPDYCNNPADAIPIIIENKIAAVPQLNGDLWICSYHPFYVTTNNLYRAAMEVFLLMKDTENENNNNG